MNVCEQHAPHDQYRRRRMITKRKTKQQEQGTYVEMKNTERNLQEQVNISISPYATWDETKKCTLFHPQLTTKLLIIDQSNQLSERIINKIHTTDEIGMGSNEDG